MSIPNKSPSRKRTEAVTLNLRCRLIIEMTKLDAQLEIVYFPGDIFILSNVASLRLFFALPLELIHSKWTLQENRLHFSRSVAKNEGKMGRRKEGERRGVETGEGHRFSGFELTPMLIFICGKYILPLFWHPIALGANTIVLYLFIRHEDVRWYWSTCVRANCEENSWWSCSGMLSILGQCRGIS